MKKLAAKIEALANTLPDADFLGKRVTVSEGEMKVTFDATRPAALSLVKKLKKRFRKSKIYVPPHYLFKCLDGPLEGHKLDLNNHGQVQTAFINVNGQIGRYVRLKDTKNLAWRTT